MLTLFRTKMSQKRKTKEEIVAEYLTGNYTYRELGLKYDIPFRSICDWVLEYQGRKPTWREKIACGWCYHQTLLIWLVTLRYAKHQP
jgi:transposase-like protein